MDITVSATDRGVRVVVAGDLDISTTGRLDQELDAVLARWPVQVQVDLSAVTFFSFAAAQMLSGVRDRATGPLTLVGATRPARRLLEIMQLMAS
jgi:anti-anti-sigma regulatory factor